MEDEDMSQEPLQQELSCPVCTRFFEDPYLLPCSHSFCKDCLDKTSQRHRKCPVCRAVFNEGDAVPNRALSNASEVYRRQLDWRRGYERPGADICRIHLKPLELFCEKDEEPVCVDCVIQHQTHTLWPLRTATSLCQKQLTDKVEILERKKESYKKMTHKLSSTVEYIKHQAQQAENQIKAEFQRLRELLNKEELLRLKAVETEGEQKIAVAEKLNARTKAHIVALTELIDNVKKEQGNEELTFLLNFKNLKNKAQWMHEDPRLPEDSLLNMASHVGSLSFKIWKDMQSHVKYYPVVLDPSTACPWLSLSDDLTSMKESSERLTSPDNPERFDPCVFVLGAEGYTSGKLKWDVAVGDSTKWIVGVCKESLARKKKFTVSTTRGVWSICLSKGMYYALTPERTELQVQPRPKRIRIRLNVDKGEVSFWDGENEKHLITFTHKFSEKMFPIFGPGLCSEPMILVPGKMAVHTS
ncbi:zinc-binding protein A33-like [Solea senegalensis]|uniref:Zinc-binding protein A33-like n=1 Tax=Solea senegalensis TaxID=28829 RepID=A0AAV6PTW4_SOLSE|nr:tripartite motif containing 35-28 [Solea senegalensis]KAG7476182.1 zinc-binding protein A33-like [Solea senegalensis]